MIMRVALVAFIYGGDEGEEYVFGGLISLIYIFFYF